MGTTRIIVPVKSTTTQIRRRFVRAFPNRVPTKINVLNRFRGQKGVSIRFKRRKT